MSASPRSPRRTVVFFHVATPSGPLRSLEDGVRWLASEGQVTVVAPGYDEVGRSLGDCARTETIPYQTLGRPRGPISLARALADHRRTVAAVRDFIRRARPDLVIVATAVLPALLVAARDEGVPALLVASELFEDARGRDLAGIAVARFDARLASAVAAPSVAAGEVYRRQGLPVVTTPAPISDRFEGGDGSRFRAAFRIDPQSRLVLSVGNVTQGRGQDVLLDAVEEMIRRDPDVSCVIVGEPLARARDREFALALRARTAEPPLRGHVVFTPRAEPMADAYAAADVVVNPVVVRESFGRVCAEAMRAGTPVVSSAAGAVGELLEHERNALLVPPSDSAALTAALERVLGDPELAGRLARQGRADVIERHSPERALGAFQTAVAAALEAGTGGASDT